MGQINSGGHGSFIWFNAQENVGCAAETRETDKLLVCQSAKGKNQYSNFCVHSRTSWREEKKIKLENPLFWAYFYYLEYYWRVGKNCILSLGNALNWYLLEWGFESLLSFLHFENKCIKQLNSYKALFSFSFLFLMWHLSPLFFF